MAVFLVGFYAITLTRKDVPMENSSLPENGKKKRWTVEEKAQIVRRYLKDHVGLADLAEETGRTPGLILGWAKQALEGIEQTFSREMHPQRKVLHREIQEKEDRIRRLESVVSELSTENLELKKSTGDLSPEPTLRRRRRKRS
jgi:transposase-like protein